MAASFRDTSPNWNRLSGIFRTLSTSSTDSDTSLQLNPIRNSRINAIKPSYMSDYDTSSFCDGSDADLLSIDSSPAESDENVRMKKETNGFHQPIIAQFNAETQQQLLDVHSKKQLFMQLAESLNIVEDLELYSENQQPQQSSEHHSSPAVIRNLQIVGTMNLSSLTKFFAMEFNGVKATENVSKGISFEVGKEVAEMIASSKSTSHSDLDKQIVVYSPESVNFVESIVSSENTLGVKRMIEYVSKGLVNPGGVVGTYSVDNEGERIARVVEGVSVNGVNEKMDDVHTEGKMAVSDSLAELFSNKEQEVLSDPLKKSKENVDQLDKALQDLDDIGKIGQFDDECVVLEESSSAPPNRKSKATPKRKQPQRLGKRKFAVKDKKPKSSARNTKKQKVFACGRKVLSELECSEEFFRNEGLMDVYELIKFQGWEKLCAEHDFVCPQAVTEFYSDLNLKDGKIPTLEFKVKKQTLRVSSIELAAILKVDHEGYDVFTKGGSWPADAEEKEALTKMICKIDTTKGSISTQFMDPKVKILHKLLVTNYLQRGTKSSHCQTGDLLILDKILNKEKVNLPKLMIHQIYHLRNLTQVGFARVIKKILNMHQAYEVTDVEKHVVKEFDAAIFRKMKLMKDAELGWVRMCDQEDSEMAGDDEDDEEEDVDVEPTAEYVVLQRLAKVEKGIQGLKTDMKSVKGNLKELMENMEVVKEGVETLLSIT